MADQHLSIFISYSRADSEFVDRLDADVRARGYRTWVDRRRLEGGVDWEREINAAIAGCDLFLISLSPPAVAPAYVRHEFEEGQRLGKRLMPVRYQNYTTPTWFTPAERIQQQDFTSASAYALNLKRLLYAIQDPTLTLSASTDDLYAQALKVRATDPERAAIIFQHIVDREPTYFGGQAQHDLVALETQLYTARAARLHTQAEQARKEGQYGVEAASLEALLTLGRQDARAFNWAEDYLPIAKQNRGFMGPYGVIQQSIANGDTSTARTLLQNLWSQAPYFGDPANIAPKLGLAPPLSRVQDIEVAAERGRFHKACAVLEAALSNQHLGKVRSELRSLAYDLDDSAATSFIDQKIKAEQDAIQAQSRVESLDSSHSLSGFKNQRFILVVQWGFAIVYVLAYVAYWMNNYRQIESNPPGGGPLLQYCGVPLAGLIVGALVVGAGTGLALELIHRAHRSQVDAEVWTAHAHANAAYQQWRHLAEQVLRQRIDAINCG